MAQIFVYGHSLENHLVAVGVLDGEVLQKWAETNEKNFQEVKDNLNAYPELKTEIFKQFDVIHGTYKLNSLEKIKAIHLTLDPFTPQNGILTPSMKLRRHNAKITFEKELEQLYKE